MSTAQDIPWCKRHTVVTSHWKDITLEVSEHDVPASLVDAEGGLVRVQGVFVGSGDDPSWGVGNAEVEDFSLLDEDMQGVHNFAGGSSISASAKSMVNATY